MKLEDALKDLYQKFPQLEEEDKKEKSWRKNVERSYILLGNTKEEANRMAWNDYWLMVKEERGFEISFHEIGESENEAK